MSVTCFRHHHIAGLDVAVQQMRGVRRVVPELVEGSLGASDGFREH